MELVDRQSFALGITYTLFRRKLLITLTFFSVLLFFLFAGYLITPTWEAEVLLLAEQPMQPQVTPLGNPAVSAVGGDDVAQNLALMIGGKGLAYDMVKQFHLDERTRLQAQAPPTFRDKAKLAIVKTLTFPIIGLPIMLGLKDKGEVDWVDKAAEDFRKGLFSWLSVESLPDSQVVSVKLNGETPQLATDIANALVTRLRERLAEASSRASTASRAAYATELARAKEKFDAEQAKLRTFQEEQHGVTLGAESLQKTQAYLAISVQHTRLVSEIQVVQQALQAAANDPAQIVAVNSSTITGSAVVQALRGGLHAQEVRLAGLLKERTAQHPDVLTLASEISRQRLALRREIENVVRGMEADRDRAQLEMDTLEKSLLTLPAREIVLAELTMAVDVSRQLYQSLFAANSELEMLAQSGQATMEFKVLDEAYVSPLASSDVPSWLIILVVGVMMGLSAAISLALFVEYWRDPIKSPLDLRRHNIDVLAVVR